MRKILSTSTAPRGHWVGDGFPVRSLFSHMSGTNVVASMVVFTNGVSNKGDYRKFKTSERNDDYANMREVIIRRFSGVFGCYNGVGKPVTVL